ncbi:response regulator [Reinekea forsetii]|nr:response regulator [Reinekea forsetii]
MNAISAAKTKKPILLVDDDDIDVMSLERQLKKLAITNPLVRKKNGIEAINYLHDEGLDVEFAAILVDINMPKKNGLEFLTDLRRELPGKARNVYIFTTSDSHAEQSTAEALHVSGFVYKQDIAKGLKGINFDD